MEAILIELIGISITTLLAVAHYGGIRICKTEHLFVLTLVIFILPVRYA
jgi:uncharacterized membrane protein (Fun14 family)